jgi:hypothetical protein
MTGLIDGFEVDLKGAPVGRLEGFFEEDIGVLVGDVVDEAFEGMTDGMAVVITGLADKITFLTEGSAEGVPTTGLPEGLEVLKAGRRVGVRLGLPVGRLVAFRVGRLVAFRVGRLVAFRVGRLVAFRVGHLVDMIVARPLGEVEVVKTGD